MHLCTKLISVPWDPMSYGLKYTIPVFVSCLLFIFYQTILIHFWHWVAEIATINNSWVHEIVLCRCMNLLPKSVKIYEKTINWPWYWFLSINYLVHLYIRRCYMKLLAQSQLIYMQCKYLCYALALINAL